MTLEIPLNELNVDRFPKGPMRLRRCRGILILARKHSKRLLALNHPDLTRGSDSRFKEINAAIQELEIMTQEFERDYAALLEKQEAQSLSDKKVKIILGS